MKIRWLLLFCFWLILSACSSENQPIGPRLDPNLPAFDSASSDSKKSRGRLPYLEDRGVEILVTNEAMFPTPMVLMNLDMMGLMTEEQKNAFDIDVSERTVEYLTAGTTENDFAILSPDIFQSSSVKVIDLGAGHGSLSPFLWKLGADVVALDLFYGEPLAEEIIGREYALEFEKKYRSIMKKADATAIPFADGSMDWVLSHKLLNNITDEQIQREILNDAYRVLARGGTLRINDGDEELYRRFVTELQNRGEQIHAAIHTGQGYCNCIVRVGDSYPSDTFTWDKTQQLLFSPNTGVPISNSFKGKPFPLLRGEKFLWFTGKALLVIKKKL